jgi:solute:Na+ symporter, SSS family
LSVAWFEWSIEIVLNLGGPFTIIALGYIFIPLYLKSNLYTVPQFLEKRYGKSLRFAFAIFTLFSFIFTRISVTIFTGSLVFQTILGWDEWVSVGVILGTSSLYSVIGGLHAIMITDFLQSFVLIFGSGVLLIISIFKGGGISTIVARSPEKFHLWKPITDPDFPWLGLILGVQISSFYYWCTDQVIIQTVLSAKNLGNAQTATVEAGSC